MFNPNVRTSKKNKTSKPVNNVHLVLMYSVCSEVQWEKKPCGLQHVAEIIMWYTFKGDILWKSHFYLLVHILFLSGVSTYPQTLKLVVQSGSYLGCLFQKICASTIWSDLTPCTMSQELRRIFPHPPRSSGESHEYSWRNTIGWWRGGGGELSSGILAFKETGSQAGHSAQTCLDRRSRGALSLLYFDQSMPQPLHQDLGKLCKIAEMDYNTSPFNTVNV